MLRGRGARVAGPDVTTWAGAAGHGPDKCVPDRVRPGERDGRREPGSAQRFSPAICRIGGLRGIRPADVASAGHAGQPAGQLGGQPLPGFIPAARGGQHGPGRGGNGGPAQRGTPGAARAGLDDPGGQPAQRLRADGERQVTRAGDLGAADPAAAPPRPAGPRAPRRRGRDRPPTGWPAGTGSGGVAAWAAARRRGHRAPAAGQRRAAGQRGAGQLTGRLGRTGRRGYRVAQLAGDHSEKGIRAGPARPQACSGRPSAASSAVLVGRPLAASSRTTRIISPGSNGLVR